MINSLFLVALILFTVPPVKDPLPSAQLSIEIPKAAEVKLKDGFITFTPVTNAVSVMYIGLDGVDPTPQSLLADKRIFALSTRGLDPEVQYRFRAIAASATGEQIQTSFAIGMDAIDPSPDPKPLPKPDDVEGLTKFEKAVRAAFATEPADEKAFAEQLGGFYLYVAGAAKNTSPTKTWNDFFKETSEWADRVGIKGRLMKVQTVVQAEFKRKLPSEVDVGTQLGEEGKKAIREAYRAAGFAVVKLK